MKKATLFAFACALFVGAQSLAAQENNGITYTEDPAQGVLLNQTKDNWFITVQGGANINFANHGSERNLSDRFAPGAGLYVGKWFSPVFGGRVGINWMTLKGVADGTGYDGVLVDEYRPNGFYKTKTNEIGPVADFMINLTNWWCGYKPNRVYNASVYVGASAFFSYDSDWDYIHNDVFGWRAGLNNSFRLSKRVNLDLDIRWSCIAGLRNDASTNPKNSNLSAWLGLTFNLGKTTWNAPIVPVIPEIENCDVYKERLRAANERISDLEKALQDCLNRPATVQTVVEEGPLATVFYPIGVSRLSAENRRVVEAVASQMNAGEFANKNFVLTGWADTYTGTDAINARLREKRAQGVKDLLVRKGVAADRLTTKSGEGNRMGEGREYVSLDRAVTIEEAR